MKKSLFILMVGFLLSTCSYDDFEDWRDMDVLTFVSLLKSGEYNKQRKVSSETSCLWGIPSFEIKDIPSLIEFAEDTSLIKDFPVNPISSYYPSPFVLGECLLWTVEGIRNDCRYISQNPILVDTAGVNGSFLKERIDKKQFMEILKLYGEWWKEVQNSEYLIKNVDPLKGTSYCWK